MQKVKPLMANSLKKKCSIDIRMGSRALIEMLTSDQSPRNSQNDFPHPPDFTASVDQ